MKPKVLVLLVALLNLVAGGSLGYVAGLRASGHRDLAPLGSGLRDLAPPGSGGRGDPPASLPGEADLASLADVLELPKEQDARVRAILGSCGTRFDAILQDVHPRLRAVHDEVLAELGRVLTKEQLDRLADEYRRRHGGRSPLPPR